MRQRRGRRAHLIDDNLVLVMSLLFVFVAENAEPSRWSGERPFPVGRVLAGAFTRMLRLAHGVAAWRTWAVLSSRVPERRRSIMTRRRGRHAPLAQVMIPSALAWIASPRVVAEVVVWLEETTTVGVDVSDLLDEAHMPFDSRGVLDVLDRSPTMLGDGIGCCGRWYRYR